MIRRVPRKSIFFIVLLVMLALMAPLPYVLVEPGTPSDTFGKVKGKPVLDIVGRESYPTNGKLNLTSIWVTSPNSNLQSFELIRAWIDGERSVQPRELFYPKGSDPKKVSQENIAQMKSSQVNAQLAALENLNIPYSINFVVAEFAKNSPNKGVIKKRDQILSFNGEKVTSLNQFRKIIGNSKGEYGVLDVLREGKEISVNVKLRSLKDSNTPAIGIFVSEDYEFPFEVKVRLKDVGGPSAGLIFTLAIIDKLTKEDLVKGRNIAGTGTITPEGSVGPIGGIEEKLIGAAREGATLFFAPALNCPDIRRTPKGLRVVPVDNLTEALSALRERDIERLPICG